MSSSLLLPTADVAGPTPAGLSDRAGPIPDEAASSESSSIRCLSSSDEDEAESKSSGTTACSSSLGSVSSLEDSLPIKKGLSSHFIGKSRSFSNISECAGGNAAVLVKTENPFNKRRRIQIVSRMSYRRRASCSSLTTTVLPPLLSPEHALQEAEEENDSNDSGNFCNEKKINRAALKSPRSFPLFDRSLN